MHQPQSEPSALPKTDAIRWDGYVQRNLWYAVAGIFAFAAVTAVVGVVFEDRLLAITQSIANAVGAAGLVAIVFVGDAVLSPIAPDFVLLVIARTSLAEHGWALATLLGVVSWLAGCIGWAIGSRLQGTSIPRWLFGRGLAENRAVFQRYGRWSVGIGALTPLPFSLTCWSAGMLSVPFRDMVAFGALRIPRILVAYGCIAYADDLLALFF